MPDYEYPENTMVFEDVNNVALFRRAADWLENKHEKIVIEAVWFHELQNYNTLTIAYEHGKKKSSERGDNK